MNCPRYIILYLIFIFSMLSPSIAAASSPGRQYTISGNTMGTFYTIKFISTKKESALNWKSRIEVRLKEVNKELSMYDPESELSLFNRQKPGNPMHISQDFYSLFLTAQRIYLLTGGAWDGTVKPLVDLWGFGTEKRHRHIPGPDKIALALSKTGFKHIRITGRQIIDKTADVTLDLGSIAKGYGVDAVAAMFKAAGIHDVLVEIGGELSASGRNKKARPWSVGISRPDEEFAGQRLYKIVRLKNYAIATSGNYRNFFKTGKKTFSHIINPKTGFPINNIIVSASVISKTCTFADGLATALMVMDVKKGLGLINRLENTECLIIMKKNKGFSSHMSRKFNTFVIK